MTDMIDIRRLRKAEVLKALYDNASPQGMGLLHYTPGPMPLDEAERLITQASDLYFDYVRGRVIKCSLVHDHIDPRLYDRDNGAGACAAAIAELRERTIEGGIK